MATWLVENAQNHKKNSSHFIYLTLKHRNSIYNLYTILSHVFDLTPTTDSLKLTEPRWGYHRLCARLETTCIWSSLTQEPYYPGFSSWPNILWSSMFGWIWKYAVATTITYVSSYHSIANLQMQPSYHPRSLYQNNNITSHPITQPWHQNGKCPENTIPIRRTTVEDVLRASNISMYGKKRTRSIPNLNSINSPDTPNVLNGHQVKEILFKKQLHVIDNIPLWLIQLFYDCSFNFIFSRMEKHAVAAAKNNKCYGTKACFNLWRPTIARANDFSLSQLWVTAGSYSSNDLNTIEAGWQVR